MSSSSEPGPDALWAALQQQSQLQKKEPMVMVLAE
jgi:hypothetical protein